MAAELTWRDWARLLGAGVCGAGVGGAGVAAGVGVGVGSTCLTPTTNTGVAMLSLDSGTLSDIDDSNALRSNSATIEPGFGDVANSESTGESLSDSLDSTLELAGVLAGEIVIFFYFLLNNK